MHGLCPGPHWGSLHHSLNPLARLRALLLKGKGGKMEGRGEMVPPVFRRKECPH